MDGAVYESIILPFVLFVIASALSSVLNVLGIVSDLMGTGIASISSSALRLSNSGIDKYDGKFIDGSSVKAAINDFGKSNQMAVLVHNKGYGENEYVNYAYLLEGAEPNSEYEFAGEEPYVIDVKEGSGTNGVFKENDAAYYTGSRKVNDDGLQPSSFEIRGTNQKTSKQYITTTASYYSLLIRDNRGDVIGATFTEQ